MFKIKIDNTETKKHISNISKGIKKTFKKSYEYFKDKTPYRTGNAKSRTKFVNNNTIHADYRYAKRLDTGYSKQAPDGMTNPTLDYLEKELKKLVRKTP